jgi:3-oxoacyl-[acyl-carrier protein] reductase
VPFNNVPAFIAQRRNADEKPAILSERTLRIVVGPRRIRVNSLNPDMVETDGLRASGLHKGEFREQQENTRLLAGSPRQMTSLWPPRFWPATMRAGTGQVIVAAGGKRM